ncbi:MAG: LD-carboxypeptidase [Bacteroidaceae bacterium]|nr:LD-carboxypeptidase [Bacteroidaceae bacterium]
MLKPQSLKRGDTIAIASPAGAVSDPSIVEGAAATLRSWGLNVIIAPHCLSREGYYAGSIEERRDDFLSLIADDNIKAILCSYGGYGCLHIIDAVAEAIKENPKWIIGMSDCSVLHAACLAKGVMSLHAPQCRHLSENCNDEAAQYMRRILFGESVEYIIDSHPYNIEGAARGRIVGGNLSVLHALLRTPYDIFKPGTILFIEDINEPLYRIERMLFSLKLSGVLENLAAIVIGQFTGSKENRDFGGTVYDIIHAFTKDFNIPICYDFPVGHCKRNFPIIEGADAELKIGNDKVIFNF